MIRKIVRVYTLYFFLIQFIRQLQDKIHTDKTVLRLECVCLIITLTVADFTFHSAFTRHDSHPQNTYKYLHTYIHTFSRANPFTHELKTLEYILSICTVNLNLFFRILGNYMIWGLPVVSIDGTKRCLKSCARVSVAGGMRGGVVAASLDA